MKINFNYQDVNYSATVVVPGNTPAQYHVTGVSPGILELKYPLIFISGEGVELSKPDMPGYPGLSEVIGHAIKAQV